MAVGDRLDRIEQLFEQNEIRLGRMILQQESDNRRMLTIERTIQAMLEQRATDKLEHDERMRAAEERMRLSEERINRIEDVAVKLANIEEAQNRMLVSFKYFQLEQLYLIIKLISIFIDY